MLPCSGRWAFVTVLSILTVLLGGAHALTGLCGPFTDVAADAFCPFVLEIFYLGITTGTSPTTLRTNEQTFRGSKWRPSSRGLLTGRCSAGAPGRRLGQFWTSQNSTVLGLTTLGGHPLLCQVRRGGRLGGYPTATRFRAYVEATADFSKPGQGQTSPYAVLSAMGKILVTGATGPGKLYQIDPKRIGGSGRHGRERSWQQSCGNRF